MSQEPAEMTDRCLLSILESVRSVMFSEREHADTNRRRGADGDRGGMYESSV